jgi:hypothetical protein
LGASGKSLELERKRNGKPETGQLAGFPFPVFSFLFLIFFLFASGSAGLGISSAPPAGEPPDRSQLLLRAA